MMFSIIIPVYNTSQYLPQCLDSIVAQSFSNWEAICIDDGSTDDSGDILDLYSKKDRRFRVYHIANSGVAQARNFGLRLVQGNWICFIDSDDFVDGDFLMQFSRWVAFSGAIDIIISGMIILDEMKGCKHSSLVATSPTCIKSEECYPAEVFYTGFSQCAYSERLMRKLSFKTYSMGEDRLFFFMALDQARDILLVPGAYYYCRQRNGSATRSCPTVKIVMDQIAYRSDAWQVFSRYIKRIPRQVLDRMAISLYSMCQSRIRMLSQTYSSNELWQRWYEAIGHAVKIQGISTVHRIIMRFILKCRCNWINYMLGIIPSRCMCIVRNIRRQFKL